ncbi:MAG: hypothetical protein COA78_34700 [Blastopirellula sp.]|nr:MAG: hypothetical protein COA78_34700 [Blastopirellula sp.]
MNATLLTARLAAIVLAVVTLVSASLHAEEVQKPILLFDGKNLDQWETIGTAQWRVEKGTIIGGQNGNPKHSGLLTTKRSFQNFDLSLQFMIDEHGKYNSGVYLRNEPGARRQSGYQINIGRAAAEEYVGLHMKEWLDKGDEFDKIRKPLAWNHLRIKAVGPHIEAWLNGQKIVDYTDPAPKPEHLVPGVIALQTYGADGHNGWVKFKQIQVLELGKSGE